MNIRKLLLLIILVSGFLSLVSNSADAAELYFGAHSRDFGINQSFEIGVFLNTEEAPINAVEGKIIFPEENIIAQEVRDGGTIMNLWLEKPHLQDPGGISFSGIIPGGYTGGRGYLFSIIFKAQKKGPIIIRTEGEKILLNDGEGTSASLKRAPLSLNIVAESTAGAFLPPYDSDPPESFTPVASRDPNLLENQYFLVFVTQDKGSGISQYQVQETRGKKPKERKWVTAESPYLLHDQKLQSYVFVKAIDKAGNERIATLPPQNPLPWYKNYLVWIIIILIGLGLYQSVGKRLWLKEQKRK